MKKLTLGMMIGILIAACNNSGESDKKTDTVRIDVSTSSSTDTKGDTSSYDRMSNKITDSTEQ